MSLGDYLILTGRYWGIGSRPCTIQLYVMGSDFRELEALDPEQGPLLSVTNVFFCNPKVWVDSNGIHQATNVGYVGRGSQITILAFGHKDRAVRKTWSSGSESSDGRMVDRPGQGNNPLDLIVQSIPKSQDG